MTVMRFESTVDLGDGRQIVAYIAVDKNDRGKFDVRDYAEFAQMAVAGMFRGLRASDEDRAREKLLDAFKGDQ